MKNHNIFIANCKVIHHVQNRGLAIDLSDKPDLHNNLKWQKCNMFKQPVNFE